MNRIRYVNIGLHLLVGIGAMAGGYAGLANPTSPLGAPLSMLEHSPFASFFLPALFLFAVLGIGNILCSIALFFFPVLGMCFSLAWGILLFLWIVIQCIMIRDVVLLHVIFFFWGLAQATLAFIHLKRSGELSGLVGELFDYP